MDLLPSISEYITENIQSMTMHDMAHELGVTFDTVWYYVRSLGLEGHLKTTEVKKKTRTEVKPESGLFDCDQLKRGETWLI